VHDGDTVLGEPLRNEGAVARARVGLDAEERRCAVGRQLGNERVEVGGLEDLVQVPLAVLRRPVGASSRVIFGPPAAEPRQGAGGVRALEANRTIMEGSRPRGVKPSPTIIWIAILGVIVAYVLLFASLLIDTWHHADKFEPRGVQTFVTPLLSGALGLVLALSLGVDPDKKIRGDSLRARLKSLLASDKILLLGGFIYLVSAFAGGYVWYHKDNVTPAIVSTVVMTVAGYAAAAMAGIARRP
jgi:hypothetical protein